MMVFVTLNVPPDPNTPLEATSQLAAAKATFVEETTVKGLPWVPPVPLKITEFPLTKIFVITGGVAGPRTEIVPFAVRLVVFQLCPGPSAGSVIEEKLPLPP